MLLHNTSHIEKTWALFMPGEDYAHPDVQKRLVSRIRLHAFGYVPLHLCARHNVKWLAEIVRVFLCVTNDCDCCKTVWYTPSLSATKEYHSISFASFLTLCL